MKCYVKYDGLIFNCESKSEAKALVNIFMEEYEDHRKAWEARDHQSGEFFGETEPYWDTYYYGRALLRGRLPFKRLDPNMP